LLALTDVIGAAVTDTAGAPVGRLADLVASLDHEHPPVTHLLVRRRGAPAVAVPWDEVASFEPGAGIEVAPATERPPAEAAAGLRLVRDVLDVQIIDVAGRRVARVADVDLARQDGALRIAAADIGARAVLRRLGLGRFARGRRGGAVDWTDLHLARGRGHRLQLATPAARVRRLSRSELAALVARLPAARGAEVLQAVGPEAAARALEAGRPRVGAQLVQELGSEAAAPILAGMAADDAVAALRHLSPERAERVLDRVPGERAATLRRLLAYPPATAGGLMTPDVRTAQAGEDAPAIAARLAAAPPRLDGLLTVFVLDADGRLLGAIPPRALLAGDAAPRPTPSVLAEAPVQRVIDEFALHDVLAIPVVDAERRVIGAIAVDDVLEELLAERLPGRRRFPHRRGHRRRHG
jgi:CBS domain-containing protein